MNSNSLKKIRTWGGWPLTKEGFTKQQKFQKGSIYNYSQPNALNTDYYTYQVDGGIWTKYSGKNEISGSYGFVISEEYSKTKNGLTTKCQNFDGGEICDQDLPADSPAQKALSNFLGYAIDSAQIKNMCGVEYVEILNPNGIAYYHAPTNTTNKIIGSIYTYWKDHDGCNAYGLPHFSTNDKSKDGWSGQMQRFQNGAGQVFDFYYSSNTGVVILEGTVRNMYNDKGGFDKLGFPKNSTIYTTTQVCNSADFKAGKYIDIQAGRVYDRETKLYFVSGSSNVGKYFFDNEAHSKFGLPKGDEGVNILGEKSQEFELAKITKGLFSSTASTPGLTDVNCSGVVPQCKDTEVLVGDTCVAQDPEQVECRKKGLEKFTSSAGTVKCAKVLNVPYFNQYLKDDGTYSEPADGYQMCGAAASTMVAAYIGKLPIEGHSSRLKDYMYKDEGQGITETCGPDKGGAFGLTNYTCDQNWDAGIVKYMSHMEIQINFIAGWAVDESETPLEEKGALTIEKIQSAINNNRPIIVQAIGHFFVIKGYTEDGGVIVNDSWKDSTRDGGYTFNGNGAIYYLDSFPYTVIKAAEYYL